MRRRCLVILVSLALPALASAQFPFAPGPGLPVYDYANHVQNTISAFNLEINTAKWVLDLLPLDSMAQAEAFYGDVEQMAELAAEAQLIMGDLASLQAQVQGLFGLEAAPRTTYELRVRVSQINARVYQVYGYAMRTQTLINTAVRTAQHIMDFIAQVAGLTGKLSIEQTLSQQLGKMHQLAAEGNVITAAFDHAKSTEALAPGVIDQSIQNIVDEMMRDHPSW